MSSSSAIACPYINLIVFDDVSVTDRCLPVCYVMFRWTAVLGYGGGFQFARSAHLQQTAADGTA